MSVTIHQQLQETQPCYNEMIYVVSSDNTAQPNFRYVADVYINGTYEKRLTAPAHPTYDNAVFDIHRVVESFVNYDINIAETTGVTTCPDSWVKVLVKFGEEYGLDSSGVTVYPDLTNSNSCYAFAGSLKEFDFYDWDYSQYNIDTSGSAFLTNIPRTFNIARNQSMFIGSYVNATNEFDRLVITTYNSSGSMIDEYQITNSYDDAGTVDNERFLKSICGFNLNDIPQGQLVTGTQPILDDTVSYYTLYTVNSSNDITSETVTFYVQDYCSPYDQFEIHFQNVFGWFDSFVFTHKNTKNVNITRKDYKKQTGTISATAFTNSRADRGVQNYFTSSNKQMVLRSRWLSESEFTWLTELIESPQVFWNDNGNLTAINVVDSSYELKQQDNDNLIQLELTVKLSTNNYRQRY